MRNYLNFPSHLMQEYMNEEKRTDVLTYIITYGIISFIEKYNDDIEALAKALIIEITDDRLPAPLFGVIEKYGANTWYFRNGEFDPDEITEAEKAIRANKGLYDYIASQHKENLIYAVFGVDLKALKLNTTVYTQILRETSQNSPFSTMKLKNAILFGNEKHTEFRHMVHAVVIGFHSLLGRKPYMKTTKAMIIKRALGYAGYNDVLSNDNQVVFDKYSSRRQWDKIIEELQDNWGLLYYTAKNQRGIYFSFENKMTITSFAKAIKGNRENRSGKKQSQLKDLLG